MEIILQTKKMGQELESLANSIKLCVSWKSRMTRLGGHAGTRHAELPPVAGRS